MESSIRVGRIIGILIILQMAGGILVNFVLEDPLFGLPGFLVAAASHSGQLGLAAVLGMVVEAMWVAIAITAFPVFARCSQRMALWFLVLSGVVLAEAVVENAAVMCMVSLSEAYAKANPTERDHLEAIRVVVSSARNWPHFLARIFDGLTIFVLNLVLFRFAMIPRILTGFGLMAAALQMLGVGVAVFGYDVVFPMLAPLGLSQLVLAVWLIVKGLREELGRQIEARRL